MSIAHGQMARGELEKVMLDFYRQRIQILVCTTIIENGIDVPTANTIIIDRADRIWQACGYGPDGGFPIVINLSYGLKAGPKDGHMLIEEVIRAATRRETRRS